MFKPGLTLESYVWLLNTATSYLRMCKLYPLDLSAVLEIGLVFKALDGVKGDDILTPEQIALLIEESNALITRCGLGSSTKLQVVDDKQTSHTSMCLSIHDMDAELDVVVSQKGCRYVQLIEIRPNGKEVINTATCRYAPGRTVQSDVKDIVMPSHREFLKHVSLVSCRSVDLGRMKAIVN